MKVSMVPVGNIPGVNPNEGNSAGPERMARAKAAALGQKAPETIPDLQVERAQNSIKKIKMRTQVSPDRHLKLEEVPVTTEIAPPMVEAPLEAVAPSDSLASTEPVVEVTEDTKPLSPQFAALAKQKRALQLKEQEILAREKVLETSSGDTKSLEEYRNRIKANALSVLMEEGVTYDQLTEQILASNQENPDLSSLKAEIKALKEGLDNQSKTMTDREVQAEQQVLAQIGRDVTSLISQGDDYEMTREAGYGQKVVELIHRTFKEKGEYLDTSEAAALIEKELLEEALKFANLKKVQNRLKPPAQTQTVQPDRPGTKTMRTLTNRDGSSSTSMSKRERAIAAMEGRLK